jgi:transcriptional regulator with XRE-family HTH domain
MRPLVRVPHRSRASAEQPGRGEWPISAVRQHRSMATRERPGDRGAADARRLTLEHGREIRAARRRAGISQATTGRRAGLSATQLSRLERNDHGEPTVEQLCRAARAVGLKPSFRLYPDESQVHDAPQLALLARLEAVLAAPLRLRREVGLPMAGDLRAWDGRLFDGDRTASIEGEARLDDVQAVSRRVALKERDDPDAGVIILLVNRTARNRRVLAIHREALRGQFPLDGAAILLALRQGKVPAASGIVLL